jgi:hypothetical protein
MVIAVDVPLSKWSFSPAPSARTDNRHHRSCSTPAAPDNLDAGRKLTALIG